MRPGQHNNNNNKRGRGGRNRSRHTGGGSSSGGSGSNYNGNPANRVYDSNGPDVKLRGTAQTIAEKYMQLGRDAQASSDTVASESYFQHSEHYYRLWLANQPVGQPIQFSRRNDEEFEEDGSGDGEGDDEMQPADAGETGSQQVPTGVSDGQPVGEGGETGFAPDQPRQREFRDNQNRDGQNRDNQNRDNQNREGGRERFKPRWPRRNERSHESQGEGGAARDVANQDVAAAPVVEAVEPDNANWEAPSFLTRPVPVIVPDVVADEDEVAAAPLVRKPRREFKPRRPREDAAETTPATPVPEDATE